MVQRVDPFIPLRRRPRVPAGPYGRQYFRKPGQAAMPKPAPGVLRRPAVDGIIRRPVQPAPTRPAVQSDVRPEVARPAAKLEQIKPARRLRPRFRADVLKTAAVLVAAVCVGLFIQSLAFGEILIGVYAAVALVRRIPSRSTFLLALIGLITVALLTALQGDSDTSDNFAVYVFLLLVVGTVSLGREVYSTN